MSRSVERRIAAQKGEPAPRFTFTRDEVLWIIRLALDEASAKCGKGLIRANIGTIDPADILDRWEKEKRDVHSR